MSAPTVPIPFSMVFDPQAGSYTFSPGYSNSLPAGVHTIVCTWSGPFEVNIYLSKTQGNDYRFQQITIPAGVGTRTASVQGVSVKPGEQVYMSVRAWTLPTQADVAGRARATATFYTTSISP